ncbi:hypothetical protein PFLUV_G00068780 [Perca fluviatilis]|uniref:Complex 1 LYR protein domain-containing protein n=3 Tax=Percidae TaxID=8165 RepID=A0A6A5F6D0_PERFL|nr:hypothetical protein PFLUV_G00068780 [Perca fluviatilis]
MLNMGSGQGVYNGQTSDPASVQHLNSSDDFSANQSTLFTPLPQKACIKTRAEKLTKNTVVPMARHSKLQKQVLALYRQFLRAGQDKPGFIPRIRDEFRVNACIKKTDVMHIEYLYRRGQRQLEQLRDVNTKQLGSFSKPAEKS